MRSLTRKLATARRVFTEERVQGISAELMAKRPFSWFRPAYWRTRLLENHWLLGRVVEMMGNRVRIRGAASA